VGQQAQEEAVGVCRGSFSMAGLRAAVKIHFYGVCPNCECRGLVDHGSGHRECLICGYDSARDDTKHI